MEVIARRNELVASVAPGEAAPSGASPGENPLIAKVLAFLLASTEQDAAAQLPATLGTDWFAALGGDTVCRRDLLIEINGTPAGSARRRDSLGRELPVWKGCRTIAADELFVMNRRAPGSFDGRYFGPVARADVIGRARPVWTNEAGDGDYVLLASPADFPIPNVNDGDAQ